MGSDFMEAYWDTASSLMEDDKQAIYQQMLNKLHLNDPVEWAIYHGFELTPYQAEALRGLADQDKAIIRQAFMGPRGAGKTYLGALFCLWVMDVMERCKIKWRLLTTAPVFAQLKDSLWPEIHILAQQVSTLETKDRLMDMRYKGRYGFATARTVNKQRAGNLEGLHADYVAVVMDESKGIPDEIFDSIEGSFSQAGTGGKRANILAISTPGPKTGRFFHIQQNKYPGIWNPKKVTIDETIEAGLVSQAYVDDMRTLWGESSIEFQQHILGEFAVDESDVYIPSKVLAKSAARWNELMEEHGDDIELGELIIGLDPAAEGQDQTVAAFYNPTYHIVWKLDKEDKTDNLADLGHKYALAYPHATIIVDADGLGNGVWGAADQVSRPGETLQFKAQTKSTWDTLNGSRAANSKAEIWLNIRELLMPLQGDILALPEDEQLWGDLQAHRQKWLANDRIGISSKDEVKKVLSRSPDSGDAVAMALWNPRRYGHQALPAVSVMNIRRDVGGYNGAQGGLQF